MLQDVEAHPNKFNWTVLVRNFLSKLGFYEVWVQQGVGNYNVLILLFKQRHTDNYVQNTNARLQTHSRARFFNFYGSFQFHEYSNLVRIPKYKYSLIKLRLSSHRLAVETDRLNKPHPIPFEERKCRFLHLSGGRIPFPFRMQVTRWSKENFYFTTLLEMTKHSKTI